MQKALSDYLKDQFQELANQHVDDNRKCSGSIQSRGERHPSSSSYSCGTRLARIDFPPFSGDNIRQWLFQCENYFLIDHTP